MSPTRCRRWSKSGRRPGWARTLTLRTRGQATCPAGDRNRQANRNQRNAHTAATNRQIDAYNKAVGEVNRGEYTKALKMLDELLAGATDPEVIRDAKKLQKQLVARRRG